MCGVRTPDDLLTTYSEARIRQVCTAALLRTGKPLHNKGGWVTSALNRGFKLPPLIAPQDVTDPAAPGQLLQTNFENFVPDPVQELPHGS